MSERPFSSKLLQGPAGPSRMRWATRATIFTHPISHTLYTDAILTTPGNPDNTSYQCSSARGFVSRPVLSGDGFGARADRITSKKKHLALMIIKSWDLSTADFGGFGTYHITIKASCSDVLGSSAFMTRKTPVFSYFLSGFSVPKYFCDYAVMRPKHFVSKNLLRRRTQSCIWLLIMYHRLKQVIIPD